MKKLIIVSSKIVFSLVQIPLWFIKLFHGVGHMPNVDTGRSTFLSYNVWEYIRFRVFILIYYFYGIGCIFCGFSNFNIN